MININIANDYTRTPGSRYRIEGIYSGEDFRDTILLPKYKEAIQSNERLVINLDGGYGYATSFLEEAFGGMARALKSKDFLDKIDFISEDEPALIEEIKKYVSAAEII